MLCFSFLVLVSDVLVSEFLHAALLLISPECALMIHSAAACQVQLKQVHKQGLTENRSSAPNNLRGFCEFALLNCDC